MSRMSITDNSQGGAKEKINAMLKKFFISMLGTIAGFWISLFLAVIVGISVIGTIVSSTTSSKPSISKNSILYLDLSASIPERYQPSDIWQIIQDKEQDGDALIDILDAIRLAANDSKIEGIYINAAGSSAGVATREEIVDALRRFRESGKWIYAYGDTYTQGDYLLASVADSVFVNPAGAVDMHGVATETPFFKGLLDKLGVKMNVVRVGTFKSAVEPFINNQMSDASRLQNQVMVDSIWDFMRTTIADARGVSESKVTLWADSIMATWPAEADLNEGAVSALRYRRIVEDRLRELCDLESGDDLPLVTPTEYMSAQKGANVGKDHVAVLFAFGDIVDKGEGGIVAETMVPEIISLADDDNVQAMVLRVNSGGGSAFASEQIWEALEYFKSKDKPLYVSMGDYAASGGYYISCGADRIFADHTTLTGSIGVFGLIPDFSGLVTDKLGITFSTVQSNPNATFPSLTGGLTPAQTAALQRSVEDIYEQFTSRVAEGRHMAQDSVKLIAEGRVWTGGAALGLGLVDEIGGLTDAVEAICDEVGIDTDQVVYYPAVEEKLLAGILADARRNVTVGSVTADRRLLMMMKALDRISTMNPVQARMPEVSFK